MTLKRPVTLAQARRWPAAASRRESFCARMGGMRDKLTSERTARDPRSAINRALAAWDCDKPEQLQQKHVTKGIRPMKITSKMVGAEARKNPAQKVEVLMQGKLPNGGMIRLQKRAGKFDTIINSTGYAWKYAAKGTSESDARSVYEYWMTMKNPARKAGKVTRNPKPKAPQKMLNISWLTAGGARETMSVPVEFVFNETIAGVKKRFFARLEGGMLIVSEYDTGGKVGQVPFTMRQAALDDRKAAKLFVQRMVEQVGPARFLAAIDRFSKIN